MNELIESISKYLSQELSKTNLYDIKEIELKIKSSLVILLDKKLETEHTISLKNKTKNHIRISKRNEIELKFWKDALRGIIGESSMSDYYSKIDEKLNELDLKK